MAERKIGQSATIKGKKVVWSGQNHGWQSPASHNKLKDQGKFKHGAQALDRATSSATRFIDRHAKPVADYARKVRANNAKESAELKANLQKTSIGRALNKATTGPNATQRLTKAVSDKTNVDERIVSTAANVAAAAVSRRALKGKPKATAPRSVGAAGAPAKSRANIVAPRPKGTLTHNQATKVIAKAKGDPSPGIAKNITKEQAAANARRLATRQPASRSAIASSRGQVTGRASDASGPVKSSSNGKGLARENEVVKAAPRNRKAEQNLKQLAQTQAADIAERGAKGRPTSQPPGRSTRNYLPDGGRVSPTDRGVQGRIDSLVEERIAGKRGAARVKARQQALKEATAIKQEARQQGAKQAAAYQRAQTAKAQKGTTPSSRQSMAEDMQRRPRTQPLKPTDTTTTGTRRVAANPSTGSRRGVAGRVVGDRTIRGDAKPPLTNNPTARTNFDDSVPATRRAGRSLDPATGRPYSSNNGRRSSFSDRFPVNAGPEPSPGYLKPHSGDAKRYMETYDSDLLPGLSVRKPAPGKRGGVRPTDDRGASTPTYFKGSATNDRVQTRDGRRIGRLGQQGQWNVDSPEAQSRKAALRTAERGGRVLDKYTGGSSRPSTPNRKGSSSRSIDVLREQSRRTREQRHSQPRDQRSVEELKRGYDATLKRMEDVDRLSKPDYTGKPSPPAATTRSGEVRLQGSQYSASPDAKSQVDGSVTRSVGRPGNQSRSAEASAQAKETMESIRKKGVDKKGNDLNKIMEEANAERSQ